jgi:hypothetical protein
VTQTELSPQPRLSPEVADIVTGDERRAHAYDAWTADLAKEALADYERWLCRCWGER